MASEIMQDDRSIDNVSRNDLWQGSLRYDPEAVSTDNKEWFVLYVKSRFESVAQADLTRRGIETYLPLIKRLRQWKDRKKLVEFPLFPGYLFVYIPHDPEEYLRVLKARGIVTFISLNPGYPTPVPSDEIHSLKILVESGEEFDIYSGLKEGDRVTVKRGPLKGAEGVIKKREDRYLFLVNVELLGRSIGVNVYADDIEAI